MNFEEWCAALAAKAETALTALENFNQAHPEIASVEGTALSAGVTDLANTAKTAVPPAVPLTAKEVIDMAIAAVDAKAQADIATVTQAADAQKAALSTAKSAVV